jgi:hypothetical protein
MEMNNFYFSRPIFSPGYFLTSAALCFSLSPLIQSILSSVAYSKSLPSSILFSAPSRHRCQLVERILTAFPNQAFNTLSTLQHREWGREEKDFVYRYSVHVYKAQSVFSLMSEERNEI